MKKLLIGVVLTLGSVSAFAGVSGLPDEDPVVKSIRENFSTSHAPTIEDLNIGKTWGCKTFFAMKGKFGVLETKEEYKFLTYDGIIQNTARSRTSDYYIFDKNELRGVIDVKAGTLYDNIRVNSKGDLITEITVKKSDLDGFKDPSTELVTSISDPSHFAMNYSVCPKAINYELPLKDYRCQFAYDFCGYNGGRYGKWIKASTMDEASIACRKHADSVGVRFCQVQ